MSPLRTRYAEHKRNVHRSKREAIALEVLRAVADLRRKGINPTIQLVLTRIPEPQGRSPESRREDGSYGQTATLHRIVSIPAESAPELQFARGAPNDRRNYRTYCHSRFIARCQIDCSVSVSGQGFTRRDPLGHCGTTWFSLPPLRPGTAALDGLTA